MASNSIVIICDDEIIAKMLRVKLSTLREVDSIKIGYEKDAIFEIESNTPDVLILFSKSNNPDIFSFVKEIKPTAIEYNTLILLVSDELNEDFVLSGFDAGVDDFVSLKNSDGEILMRVILCMQKNELLKDILSKKKLLTELKVLQEDSGFYLKEYSAKVFANEIQNLQKYSQTAVFMAIAADIRCKTILTPSLLGSVIKNCTRNRDIIGFCGEDKYYVLLPKTSAQGCLQVYERIKKELNEGYSISVGACEIDTLSFEEIEKNVSKALLEALDLGNSIVVYDANEFTEPMNWLDSENSGQKNFKFFQAAFLKKLENVITPTFYQVQQIWEDRLFRTTIEHSSNESQSIFVLKSGEHESKFKITYPGFAKINIDIFHNFVGLLPKERISLDLNELDNAKLTELLVNFVKEYQSYIKD
ncbi:hypothetical protein IJE86_02180 [bacterium]|nr:hypothetical protein [bacterium]